MLEQKKLHGEALAKGISVVAINYRYVKNGVEEKVEPPVKAPLEDAARALQTIRSKAKEWNLDKKRIGATGGSAGAPGKSTARARARSTANEGPERPLPERYAASRDAWMTRVRRLCAG